METISIKVRPSKEAEFRKLVKKFNRCLEASGFAKAEPVLKGKCNIRIHNSTRDFDYSVEGYEYVLSVPESVLKMGEYRFIGEYRKLDGKWHRTMHSSDIKDEYEIRESNMRCDHCRRNIKNRNGYYFFRKPDGSLTVVGSTCVDAFMGFKVHELLEVLGDATEFERVCGDVDLEHEIISVDINSFLKLVYAATDGFHSWKRSGDEDSTSGRLKSSLADMFFDKKEVSLPNVQNVEQMIDDIRQYWRSQVKFDDLTVNSKKAMDGDYVPLNWAGIAGWAMYKPLAIRNGSLHEFKSKEGEGDYVGKVGELIETELMAKKCIAFQGKWGSAWAVHFDDETGNHFLYFTSSKSIAEKYRSHFNEKTRLQIVITGQSYDRGQRQNRIKISNVLMENWR